MKILEKMQKVPGGMMVIPLLLGTVINTFFPQALEIGGFTTGVLKGGTVTIVGLFILCSGATINIKQAGIPIYRGIILTALKFFIGLGLGLLLNLAFGPAGILGLTPLAVIGAITNSNGALYTALASEFGEPTDVGAIAILSFNDGPFLTMVALGASGLATIPFMSLVACIIPIIIGIILGNLDEDMRSLLASGMPVLMPFCGFTLGAGMSLKNVAQAGFSGILLGLACVFFSGVVIYHIYNLIRREKTPMGAAVGTTAGNAVATPAAVAVADPTLKAMVPMATAQIAASVVISAILCPLLTTYYSMKIRKEKASKAV
jgi:2-keto-3-deoxygluconate permease